MIFILCILYNSTCFLNSKYSFPTQIFAIYNINKCLLICKKIILWYLIAVHKQDNNTTIFYFASHLLNIDLYSIFSPSPSAVTKHNGGYATHHQLSPSPLPSSMIIAS